MTGTLSGAAVRLSAVGSGKRERCVIIKQRQQPGTALYSWDRLVHCQSSEPHVGLKMLSL